MQKPLRRWFKTRLVLSVALGTIGVGSATLFGFGSAFAETSGCSLGIGASATNGTCEVSGISSTGGYLVNSYFAATAINGSNSVTVAPDSRNVINGQLQSGETVMLVQDQGATVNTTASLSGTLSSETTTYGEVQTTAAGDYQILTVGNFVSGTNVVTFTSAIDSNFKISANPASNFQLITVPNIQGDATLEQSLTALSWNSKAGDGGIFALMVSGQLNMNGKSIDVSGKGFSGGVGYSLSGDSNYSGSYPQLNLSTPGADNVNGQKGEGIYGTPNLSPSYNSSSFTNYVDGYSVGDFGMGALGNAGGGGTDPNQKSNDENTGGGGGGNGGTGGNGGYSWATGFDLGGRGGYSIASSANSPSLVLGGGGGAGTINNAEPSGAGSGGAGGGIIYLQLGGISGPGTISANGGNGITTPNNDGSGGGGAGGTIFLQTSALCDNESGLTIDATGGNGGNTWSTQPLFPAAAPKSASGMTNVNGNAHGPGGGGGGGMLYTNLTAPQNSLVGGEPGTTTQGSGIAISEGIAYSPSVLSIPTRFSGPLTLTQLNYGAAAGDPGVSVGLSSGPRPSSSTLECVVPIPTTVPTTSTTVVTTTTVPPTTTIPPTTTTLPSAPALPSTSPVVNVTEPSSQVTITVPTAHTGEPWSSSKWWLLTSAIGLSGLILIFPRRKNSNRSLGK